MFVLVFTTAPQVVLTALNTNLAVPIPNLAAAERMSALQGQLCGMLQARGDSGNVLRDSWCDGLVAAESAEPGSRLASASAWESKVAAGAGLLGA
jgi:hypothetical protein